MIEVDGISHDSPESHKSDQTRDQDLAEAGITVLRFSDWEVLNQMADVSIMIGNWIDENAEHPPPNPRQRGRG